MRHFLRFLVLVSIILLLVGPSNALEDLAKEGCASNVVMESLNSAPPNADVCHTCKMSCQLGPTHPMCRVCRDSPKMKKCFE